MKIWAPILLAAIAAVGCQSQQKPAARTSASVLDVSGPPARQGYQQPVTGYQPTAQYAPPTTTTPPYMLPSATPPPEPIPAAVVETHAPQQPVAAPPARPRGAKSAPPVADAAVASAGARYTVKQGDTLYHIAKVTYGDGKQWQRIATANPGVSPTSLKVGQVLVMP